MNSISLESFVTGHEILVVDDNPENLKVLGGFLREEGFDVRIARDGQQALDSVAAAPPDLILLDIHMPVMDGYETCQQLKTNEQTRGIPIVFLSALGETFNKVRAFDLGAADYIVKPFELDEVRVRVRTQLLANQLLVENRAGFRASFEQAAVGMLHVRLDGVVQVANSRAAEILGDDAAAMKGRNLADIACGELGTGLMAQVDRFRSGEGPAETHTWSCPGPDGKTRCCRATCSLVHVSAGLMPYAAIILEDITHQRELEVQLRQSQKMEAMGTLAAGIAHDFNNLLAAILGFTELSLDELPQDSPARENMREVLGAGGRARDLVRQILAFGRQSDYKVRPIDLRDSIDDVLRLLRRTIPPTIEFQPDLAMDCPPVLADVTAFHQILMNLCTNAYHAMEESGGVLGVRLSTVSIDAEQLPGYPDLAPGRYARLTVSDTGHGMDEATRVRIFEPYFTTKERNAGTGLGLATAHGIVSDLNGVIDVYSEPGNGTTFTVLLPVAGEGGADVDHDVAVFDQGQGERILFVDDEAVICRFAEKALDRLGYKATVFTEPGQALDQVRQTPDAFDVIITDEMMPGMRGSELLGELRKVAPKIPVILYSGFAGSHTPGQDPDQAFDGYVVKPLVTSELAQAIRQVLDKS